MEVKRWKRWSTTALIVLWSLLPVTAGPIDHTSEACFDKSLSVKPEGVWIPVGCELADCCPDCNSSTIDWHIRLSGDPAESAILKFENLPQEAINKLTIKGNAKWEGDSFLVGKGDVILAGFTADLQATVPVAIPQIDLTGQWSADTATAELEVKQVIGQIVVNESKLIYVCTKCPPPSPSPAPGPTPVATPSDRIDLTGNIGGDNTVLILDGRFGSGCKSDRVFRGVSTVSPGNILSNGSCADSEIVVFSDDNAMKLVTGIGVWTDGAGDVLPVSLSPILSVPVTIWLMRSSFRTVTQAEIATANLLYNSNNVGIAFNATYQDVSANTMAVSAIGKVDNCAQGTLDGIKAAGFYAPNQLNVYYVNNIKDGLKGINCGLDRTIQFIGGNISTPETLAHEFGHSFSLVPDTSGGHVNGLAGFNANNIMWGGGTGRTKFSIGQAFRMNVNSNSQLNEIHVRSGPTRNCPPLATPSPCPRLALSATPE